MGLAVPEDQPKGPQAVSGDATGAMAEDVARFASADLVPDPSLLALIDPAEALRVGYMPLHGADGRIVVAVADGAAQRAAVTALGGDLLVVQAPRDRIQNALADALAPALALRARTLCPPGYSCRVIGARMASGPGRAVLVALALGVVLWPWAVLLAVMLWILAMNMATTLIRLGALVMAGRPPPPARPPDGALPAVSVLCPLLHEDQVLPHLIAALDATTYPHHLLDVKLLLEADDTITASALALLALPPWAQIIRVPPDSLRTKPRAMNYALPFCRGQIIGIYDAEDRPAPDQILRAVSHLHAALPQVACVQGILDFYNARANWIARCFAIEYAVWFRVILRGLQRMRLPLPLGGTSVFLRREVLERVGGWDAHNVTEDADLGMRLARFGYRCEMFDSPTYEECNCRARPWVRQRSRWLKGFAMTWISHMRRPWRLARDLGLWRFAGFQVLILGGITAFAAAPVLWLMWFGYLGLGWPGYALLPDWLQTGFFAAMLLGQSVMLALCVVALWARQRRHLLPWVITLPLYWPLGALAAWRALAELFFAPFHWHKTRHGLDTPLPAPLHTPGGNAPDDTQR